MPHYKVISMKISVITGSYNCCNLVTDAINSVQGQQHANVEHIIVDGGSTDGTLDIINSMKTKGACVISERDKGPYDAMNKGIIMATGDIVGILNSDDMFADSHVLERIETAFRVSDCDACYADLVYVDRADTTKAIRYWKSGEYRPENFRRAWIPPHPTFYVKRSVYEKYGLYDLSYSLAADYELMLRFIVSHGIKLRYIDKVAVKMRLGGITNKSVSNIVKQNIEIMRARRKYGVNGSAGGYLAHKAVSRIKQYVYGIQRQVGAVLEPEE